MTHSPIQIQTKYNFTRFSWCSMRNAMVNNGKFIWFEFYFQLQSSLSFSTFVISWTIEDAASIRNIFQRPMTRQQRAMEARMHQRHTVRKRMKAIHTICTDRIECLLLFLFEFKRKAKNRVELNSSKCIMANITAMLATNRRSRNDI